MRLKRKPCQNWRLYVIADPEACKGSLGRVVAAAIAGGADVIQLRDKRAGDAELVRRAKSLLRITRRFGVPLIVNDRPGVAKAAGADGVHLGQDDGGWKEARSIVGEEAIIGRSTHSLEQALAAQAEGFDYIGVGPVFSTPTKPFYSPVGLELVQSVSRHLKIPFVAIGGINAGNAGAVRQAGARAIAVVRAVMAAENPERAARRLKGAL